MKRILLLISVLILSTAEIFANELRFGIEGGAGFNTMEFETDSRKSDYDFIPGFRTGLGIEYRFSDVTALQLKTFYHHNNGFSFISGGEKQKTSFGTVEIPLLLKLTFAGIDTVPGRFSISAGPLFSFFTGDFSQSAGGTRTGQKGEDFLDGFAAGMECGVEYEFNRRNGFRAGMNVGFDISSFTKKDNGRRVFILPYLGYYF